MKPTLVFATGNPNKLREVRELIGQHYDVKGLSDIGCTEDIPETSPTIAGNALQKAHYVRDNYGLDCFSEDTGLEVDALNGDPGIYSARYAGPHKDPQDNMQLLLQNLAGTDNRGAQFRTVIALLLDGEERTFEGIVRGHILEAPRGTGGFGYDPIFVPEGYDQTFAELDASAKNQISHRGRAVRQLTKFLSGQL